MGGDIFLIITILQSVSLTDLFSSYMVTAQQPGNSTSSKEKKPGQMSLVGMMCTYISISLPFPVFSLCDVKGATTAHISYP